jgi:AcrR family transcriptional regulator
MIEAARTSLLSGEIPRLELAEIADRAGVARSTIYSSFGGRSFLISRLLDDSLSRAGFAAIGTFVRLPDAVEAMEKTLIQTAAMYSKEHPVLRRMLLLARLDAEVAADYGARQQRRGAAMRNLGHRLDLQHKLRRGVGVERAAAVLWVLTSFDTFDQLHSGWGLGANACGSLYVAMARSSLL